MGGVGRGQTPYVIQTLRYLHSRKRPLTKYINTWTDPTQRKGDHIRRTAVNPNPRLGPEPLLWRPPWGRIIPTPEYKSVALMTRSSTKKLKQQ